MELGHTIDIVLVIICAINSILALSMNNILALGGWICAGCGWFTVILTWWK
jgi:hypothetical protein